LGGTTASIKALADASEPRIANELPGLLIDPFHFLDFFI